MDEMLVASFLEEQTSTQTYEVRNPSMQKTMVDRLGRLCSRLKVAVRKQIIGGQQSDAKAETKIRYPDELRDRASELRDGASRTLEEKHSFNKKTTSGNRNQEKIGQGPFEAQDTSIKGYVKDTPTRSGRSSRSRDHTLQNQKKGTRSDSSFQKQRWGQATKLGASSIFLLPTPFAGQNIRASSFTIRQDVPEKHGQPKRERAANTRYQPTSANDQRSRGYFDKPFRASALVDPKYCDAWR